MGPQQQRTVCVCARARASLLHQQLSFQDSACRHQVVQQQTTDGHKHSRVCTRRVNTATCTRLQFTCITEARAVEGFHIKMLPLSLLLFVPQNVNAARRCSTLTRDQLIVWRDRGGAERRRGEGGPLHTPPPYSPPRHEGGSRQTHPHPVAKAPRDTIQTQLKAVSAAIYGDE